MAIFNKTVITEKGYSLIAKSILNNSKINFTKIVASDYDYSKLSEEDIEQLEALEDIKQSVLVNDVKVINESTVNVSGILSNTELKEEYYLRAIGLFAADPQENKEILYSITVAKEADCFPSFDGNNVSNVLLDLETIISKSSKIDLEVNPNATATIKNLNDLENKINEKVEDITTHLNDLTYETAGGMGTAITLNMQPLKQGYNKTFIASANNNGAATTINGKKLYKPNTTTAPNIISGKAYTVWYNSVSDCFFLQASATGTTSADKVLAGETFSTENDTDLVGNMPDKSGTNKALALNETWAIPKGYHDGNGKVTQNIPDNGAINANLNCGQSKSLPAGYISGGIITANSLASQTPSNADASKILSGYYAWINGSQVWGNATIESLGGARFATGKVGIPNTGDNRGTISLGFTPNLIAMSATAQTNYHAWYNSSIIPILSGGIPYRVGVNVSSSRIVVYESNDIDVSSNMHVHPIDNGFIWRLNAQAAPKDMTWVALKI